MTPTYQAKSGNKITNIINSIKLAQTCYKAMEQGAEVQAVKRMPIRFSVGCGFLDTMEGCFLYNRNRGIYNRIEAIFNSLPEDVRKTFTSSPKNNEFMSRVNVWSVILKPSMDSAEYHKAMGIICNEYRELINKRNTPVTDQSTQG